MTNIHSLTLIQHSIGSPTQSNQARDTVKLQDAKSMYKIALHSYILKKKFRKRNGKNNSFCNCNKKNKIPRNILNKECEGLIYWNLQSIIKRDWKRYNEMETYSICVHGLEEST